MKPTVKLALLASAYALVSATLVVAQQRGLDVGNAAPVWRCEEDMHDYYIRRFESADGFGLSRMPQPPMLDRTGVLEVAGTRYSVERLELVGLQSGPMPNVYVPTRHKLPFNRKDFQSRELSSFEQRALDALRKGQMVERSRNAEPYTIEVVGALRGDGTCLKCHKNAKEGDLLGAFSYRLREIAR